MCMRFAAFPELHMWTTGKVTIRKSPEYDAVRSCKLRSESLNLASE
jgi:hypothetical protein